MNLPIIYVLRSAGIGGGVRVVLEHIHRLSQRGHDVQLYYVEEDPGWFSHPIKSTRFKSKEFLINALSSIRAIKVATWYETAYWVNESLHDTDQWFYLVQDIEDSYFT